MSMAVFFADGLYPGSWRGDWRFADYNCNIIKNGADELAVKVWKTGKTGAQKYITFEKIFTLKKGLICVKD